MSDNTPKEDVRAIPQGLADDIEALGADVAAMSKRASRAWKMTALIWVILLTVIATYLYFIVYAPLRDLLEPGTLVQTGITMLDNTIQGAIPGIPSIQQSSELQRWGTQQLKAKAPEVMSKYVRPQVDRLLAELPAQRVKLTAEFKEKGPGWVDYGVEYLGDTALPELNKALLDFANRQVDQLLAQFSDQIDAVMDQVIAHGQEALEAFRGQGDVAVLRGNMEAAFEEALGPLLDEVLVGLDDKVAQIGESINVLVGKYKAGTLDHRDKLEVRLIQLTLALFEGALENMPTESQVLEQLRATLKEAGLPVLEEKDVIAKERQTQQQAGGAVRSLEEEIAAIPADHPQREEMIKQLKENAQAATKAAEEAVKETKEAISAKLQKRLQEEIDAVPADNPNREQIIKDLKAQFEAASKAQ